MTTKNDIVNYLKTKYAAEQVSEGLYSLEVKWTDGRSQLVLVVVGDNIVSVSSPVGKLSDVNLANLVKFVSETSPWGVRIVGDWVTISDAGFTESMDAVELDVPIRFISEAADEIEHALSNGGDAL